MTRAIVRVRPATDDDVSALVGLVQSTEHRTGVFSGKPLHDASGEHLRERLCQILAREERTILVAVDDDGSAVGMLAAKRDDIGAIDLTPVLHITHLLVAPGHRRRGAGRALLAAAVHLAEDLDVEKVLATAAATSREANRYLARIGFAPLVLHRLASTNTLRRSLGLSDQVGRTAVLRRARVLRAQRSSAARTAVGRGA